MHRIALVLGCLAAAGHGRRVQPSASSVQGTMHPAQSLAAFLVGLHPATGFSPSAAGLHPATGFSPSAAGVHSLAADAMQHPSRATQVQMGRKGGPSRSMGYQQQQQVARQPPPSDGTPIFYLYVRSGEGRPWYPVSQFNGDATAKALIYGWTGAWVGKGLFKEQLDKSMANSVFQSQRRLTDMACGIYKQLSKNKAQMQFGYKPESTEIKKKVAAGKFEEPGVILVTRDMIKQGWFQGPKDAMDKLGRSVKETINKR